MLFLGFWAELWFGVPCKITDEVTLLRALDKTEEQSLRSSWLTFAKRQLLLLEESLFVGALSNLSLYLYIYKKTQDLLIYIKQMFEYDWRYDATQVKDIDKHGHFMSKLQ